MAVEIVVLSEDDMAVLNKYAKADEMSKAAETVVRRAHTAVFSHRFPPGEHRFNEGHSVVWVDAEGRVQTILLRDGL